MNQDQAIINEAIEKVPWTPNPIDRGIRRFAILINTEDGNLVSIPELVNQRNVSFYDINRKQHRSRFLAPSHHAMASVRVIPSKLLPSASAAYSPV